MSIDRVQQGPVPGSVRADCVWELRRRHRGRWQTGGASPMGYSRAGRLRPAAPAVVPRHRRHPHVFQRWLARLSRTSPRSGRPKSSTSAPTFPSFWSATKRTFVTTLQPSMSSARWSRSPSSRKKAAPWQRRLMHSRTSSALPKARKVCAKYSRRPPAPRYRSRRRRRLGVLCCNCAVVGRLWFMNGSHTAWTLTLTPAARRSGVESRRCSHIHSVFVWLHFHNWYLYIL